MAKLAKLRSRELRSWKIWESLVRYANVQDDPGRAASNAQEFQVLLSDCMDRIGGAKEDIAECGDFKDGASLTELEARYRAAFSPALAWLSSPDRNLLSAPPAATLLILHSTTHMMFIVA